jgi:hypothetical protein
MIGKKNYTYLTKDQPYQHRENDIAVFPADEDVAKTIIGDGPDEGDDFVMSGVIH